MCREEGPRPRVAFSSAVPGSQPVRSRPGVCGALRHHGSPQWAALLPSAPSFGAFKAAVRRQTRVWGRRGRGEGGWSFHRRLQTEGGQVRPLPHPAGPAARCRVRGREAAALQPTPGPPDADVPPSCGPVKPPCSSQLGAWVAATVRTQAPRARWHGQRKPAGTWMEACTGRGQAEGGAGDWQCRGPPVSFGWWGRGLETFPLAAAPCFYKPRLLVSAWECGANLVARSAGARPVRTPGGSRLASRLCGPSRATHGAPRDPARLRGCD